MTTFWRGVESGACALAVSALVRWLLAGPFLPELMAQRLFGLVPMNVFEFFIRSLGAWSKWTAFGGTILVTLMLSGVAGWIAAPIERPGSPARSFALVTIGLSLVGALIGMPLLGFDPLGSDLFPRPRIPALLAVLVTSAAYAAWFFWGAKRRSRVMGASRRVIP